MKFHHNQKMLITQGYYATFKGVIKEFRTTKDMKTEYKVLIHFESGDTEVWVPEEHLKRAMF